MSELGQLAALLEAREDYGYRCYHVTELEGVRLVYHGIGIDFVALGDESMDALTWCPDCAALPPVPRWNDAPAAMPTPPGPSQQSEPAQPAAGDDDETPPISDVAVPSAAEAPLPESPPASDTTDPSSARSAPKSRGRSSGRGWGPFGSNHDAGWEVVWEQGG